MNLISSAKLELLYGKSNLFLSGSQASNYNCNNCRHALIIITHSCVCVCVCVCVRVCVHACVRVRVCVYVCVFCVIHVLREICIHVLTWFDSRNFSCRALNLK